MIIGINRARRVLATVFLAAVISGLHVAPATTQSGNPLFSGALPVCGPAGAAFADLFGKTGLKPVWRGVHENSEGELELATMRNGAWLLLYHSMDRQGRNLVCVIARGHQSRERFGRPV